MPNDEITGQRPSNFSRWHRLKLPSSCALADVDWAEVRYGHVVAFLETIEISLGDIGQAGEWIKNDPWLHSWYPNYDKRYPLWETKKVIFNYLLAVCKMPLYVIYHTPDMKKAKVVDYRRKTIREYNDKELGDWFQML